MLSLLGLAKNVQVCIGTIHKGPYLSAGITLIG
jgi:hypothetical protein